MSKVLQKFASSRPVDEEDVHMSSEDERPVKTKKSMTAKSVKQQKTALQPAQTKLTPSSSNKRSKEATTAQNRSSIIYLGHIPNGFYESEMRKFFRQFGMVKRIRLFRSKKTNNSKGYAFVEFGSPDVAETVAQSMNGYFLLERKLVAEVVPVEKHHKLMFAKYKFRRSADSDDEDSHADDDEENEEEMPSGEEKQQQVVRAVQHLKKSQKKLRALGIDFEIPSLTGKRAAEPELASATQGKKKAKGTNEKAPQQEQKAQPVTKTEKKADPQVVAKAVAEKSTEKLIEKQKTEKKEDKPVEEKKVEVVSGKQPAPRPSKIARLAKK